MAQPARSESKLKVAIIGTGPAGLGAAIELSKKSFIEWRIYEKKLEVSEIGNGLTIQRNTWKMLEHMNAAQHLKSSDFFRPADGHYTQHRNGRTGHLVQSSFPRTDTPPHRQPCRIHRAKLQQALLREVNQKHIRLGSKLTHVKRLESGRLHIAFEDGFIDEVDLLVGADGIRSVVRKFAFPEHATAYTGWTAYRTLVKKSLALDINGLPEAVIFWHGTDSKWVYTCPLGGDEFEITARIREPDADDRSSWGRDASVQHFVESFKEFCPPVKQLLGQVSNIQRYDFFAGPRLETVINHDSVVLIGDASHPLSGAFGAGAGFALEDAYVLGEAIQWARSSDTSLKSALELFDNVRSTHYKGLYDVLDEFGVAESELKLISPPLQPLEEIESRIKGVWDPKHNWMYYYEADVALGEAIKTLEDKEKARPTLARL